MLSQQGLVNETHVITDKMTGRARGFAFVALNTNEGFDQRPQRQGSARQRSFGE